MSFDPSRFSPISVVDTCAVWNMLSSRKINQAAIRANLFFCITSTVLYECLQKPRQELTEEKKELMNRLRRERSNGRFPVEACSLEDLMRVSSSAPGKLGAGELSCIAAAYRIRSIAFMTDEKTARKYAQNRLQISVETTPRLYGYLHFNQYLSDSDHSNVICEHEQFETRPLTSFFADAYNEAMRVRLMVSANGNYKK